MKRFIFIILFVVASGYITTIHANSEKKQLARQDLERLSLTNLSIFWQGLVPTIHTNDPSGCILSGRDGYICAKCWEWIKPYEEKSRRIGITVFTSQSAAIAAMEFRLRNIAPVTVAGDNDGTFPGPWHHGHSGGGLSAFMCVNYRNCIIEVSILSGGYDENATLLKETATTIISQIETLN